MEERLATQWARFSGAVQASMFPRGLVGIERIGTPMHPNRTIHRGVTQLFWICTAAVLRRGLAVPIGITAARTARSMCSPQQTLIRSLWRCWKALNRLGSNDSRIRMEE